MTVFPFILAIAGFVVFLLAALVGALAPIAIRLIAAGLALLTLAWVLQLTTTGTLVHL